MFCAIRGCDNKNYIIQKIVYLISDHLNEKNKIKCQHEGLFTLNQYVSTGKEVFLTRATRHIYDFDNEHKILFVLFFLNS